MTLSAFGVTKKLSELMTDDDFNTYCGSFAGAEYVMQWSGSHVWKVMGKLFAIGRIGSKGNLNVTFKTSDFDFHFLQDEEHYRPAPYLASRGLKWIQYYDSNVEDETVKQLIKASYQIIVASLPKKKQQSLL